MTLWGTPITGASHRRLALRLTSAVDTPAQAWRKRAACRGLEASLFHPVDIDGHDDDAAESAKAICQRCPVREACLEYALSAPENHGVWGGLTARERRRELRRRKRSA